MSAPKTLSLIDLLRRRRELPAAEVAELLAELPRKLSEAAEPPRHLLHAVRVAFPTGTEFQPLVALPVPEWPVFRLLFAAEPEDGSTMLFPARTLPAATAQLAELIYELLGGPPRSPADQAFVPPLAGLNEAGNTLLRGALRGGASGDSARFWNEWLATIEPEIVAPAMAWRTPSALHVRIEPTTVLELSPLDATQPAVRLVARDLFRIGRSRFQADWPARGPSDEDVPLGVSRRHAIGSWLPDGPAFRDGSETGPSTFGTSFDGAPLSADEPRSLGAGATLNLGGEYQLEVWRVKDAGFRERPGEEQEVAPLPTPRAGAVFFRPLDRSDLLRDAVWLGSEIAFRLDAAGGWVWGRGRAGHDAAWFLYRHGQFWLANGGLTGIPIHLAGVPLEPGEMAPLAPGQPLEIGTRHFTVTHLE